jgi:uncharacterized membrane protein YedE/YeeE
MKLLAALLSGLIFGLGLIVSGMTDPGKVLGFLDLAGNWDPSLAFVMIGAVVIGAFAFKLARQQTSSFLGAAFKIPTDRHIDKRLVFGGLTFGVGWGLAGYCPGPALASIATGGSKPIVFTLAMIAGMVVFEVLDALSQSHHAKR